MKIAHIILLLAVMICSGFYYIVLTIDYSTNDFIFGGMVIGFLLLLFLSTAFIVFRIEYKSFKKSNSLMDFKLTCICFTIFCTGLGVHFYLAIRDSSKVILEAGQKLDLTNINLEFSEVKTYKFTDGFVLGSSYYRGRYDLRDSLILLDTLNLSPLFKSNRLVRRDDRLYMIDERHKILDSVFFFSIK